MPDSIKFTFARLFLVLFCVSLGLPAVAEEEPEYRLGPGDVVSIQVWTRQDLSVTTTLDHAGVLHLPSLPQPVVALDRTESELSDDLTRMYGYLYQGIPQVVVKVEQYNSRSVTVVGEVHTPGTYAFRSIPDLYQVLLKAGLPTPTADVARIQIVRRTTGSEEPSSETVDLSAIRKNEVPKSLPILRPGDTIVVPALASNLAVTGAKFQVLGAVRTPGVYPWTDAQTVSVALALSGGPIPGADLCKAYLTRSTPSGLVSYRLDLQALLYEGETVANFSLKEGDTLTIPTKSFGPGAFFRGFLLIVPLITTVVSLIVVLENN